MSETSAPDLGAQFCRWCEHTTDNCGFPGSDVPPCCIPCGYPLEDCALRTDIETLKAENAAQAARLAAMEQVLATAIVTRDARQVYQRIANDPAVAESDPALWAAIMGFERACDAQDAAVAAYGAVGAGEARDG